MSTDTDLAWIASMVGDPTRARILLALMDGRARTAKELAFLARIAAPTASGHLAKLVESRLVRVEPQGRHRYFQLASPQAGRMIEAMTAMAGEAAPPVPPRVRAERELHFARTCYDHMAGRLAVALADALQEGGHVVLSPDGGEVTASGRALLSAFGAAPDDGARSRRRLFCRPCLDWTERRHHLAGIVGAALCRRCLDLGWVERVRDSRALTVTPAGREGFAETFGVRFEPFDGTPPVPDGRTATVEAA